MKTKNEFKKFVEKFYLKNKDYFKKTSNYVMSIHYSIPLDCDDLICFTINKILEPENKLKYFELKAKNQDINLYFKKRIKSIMFSYCNIYKTKNHQILNNIVNDEEHDFSLLDQVEGNYDYEELFPFLTTGEFNVLFQIHVVKENRDLISKNLGISKFKLKKIEDNAMFKIYKHYENNKKQ